MTDKVHVELGGKSKYEVAERMAHEILFSCEGKKKATRQEYLNAVWESIQTLNGVKP